MFFSNMTDKVRNLVMPVILYISTVQSFNCAILIRLSFFYLFQVLKENFSIVICVSLTQYTNRYMSGAFINV